MSFSDAITDKLDIIDCGKLRGPFLSPLYGIPEELVDGRVINNIYTDDDEFGFGPLDVLLYCIEICPRCPVL